METPQTERIDVEIREKDEREVPRAFQLEAYKFRDEIFFKVGRM